MINVTASYDLAIALFKDGKTKDAALVIDRVIEAAPLSEEALHLRLIKARAIEYGEWPNGPDQKRAHHEYSLLEPWVEVLREDGLNVYLGAARTLYRLDRTTNASEIERLLRAALDSGENPHVRMLYGLLNETTLLDDRAARKHFLKAFRMGLPWGLRYYARSHISARHFIRGILGHIACTILSPLMIIVFGAKGVLHENPRL